MAGSRRLPETWFRRGLWLIAVLFAVFLIGLGGLVVDRLPGVAPAPTLDSFVDRAQADRADAAIKQAQTQLEDVQSQLETARLQLKARSTAYRNARESFNDWVATRTATAQSSQDAELVARTRALDSLKAAQRDAQTQVDALEAKQLEAQRGLQSARATRYALNADAGERLAAIQRSQALKVFGIRLALTLPLLAVAGWLFARQRKSTWWPFVWGFIFFALFAFFVELVPYLPDYGGYVRYLVGIVLTILVGRYAIVSLQRYLAKQKAEEQLPDEERRKTLSYDLAQARLAKSVCPGCERPVKLDDPDRDFCVRHLPVRPLRRVPYAQERVRPLLPPLRCPIRRHPDRGRSCPGRLTGGRLRRFHSIGSNARCAASRGARAISWRGPGAVRGTVSGRGRGCLIP